MTFEELTELAGDLILATQDGYALSAELNAVIGGREVDWADLCEVLIAFGSWAAQAVHMERPDIAPERFVRRSLAAFTSRPSMVIPDDLQGLE